MYVCMYVYVYIYIYMVTIPHIKGLSEKFKRIANTFDIKTTFKTRNTIGAFRES